MSANRWETFERLTAGAGRDASLGVNGPQPPRVECPSRKTAHACALDRWLGEFAEEKGSEIVEFGLVLMPLLLAVFLLIDISWMIFAKACVQEGVREGVRYAITQQSCGAVGPIQNVVQQDSFGFITDPSQVTVTYPSGSSAGGNVVVVSATGQAPALEKLLNQNSTFSVSASSSDVMESVPSSCP